MQQIEHWKHFKKQGYEFYKLMTRTGNRFYLTHAVDKRGRAYARGYHITSQGTSFKKAMIELAQEEIVEGVPT
jgi:DNA-directed RNA polymerase